MKEPVTILFIENSETDREVFQKLVRRRHLPYKVSTAQTLAEARSRLAGSPFDVVVADYHLPDGCGTELFDGIRTAPLVLMTEALREGVPVRLRERRADDYVAKHADGSHLTVLPGIIEKTLQRREVQEAERQLKEEALDSAVQLRWLVNSVKDYAIYMLDRDGLVRTWNAGAQRITDWSAEEIVGRHYTMLFPEAEVAARRPRHALYRAGQEGRFCGQGLRMRKGGSSFWADFTVTVIRDRLGNVIGFGEVARDITDLRQVQQLLEERVAELQATKEDLAHRNEELEASRALVERERARYEELFDGAPNGYLVTDLSGIIQQANRAACQLLQAELGFLRRLPLLQFVAQPDQRPLRNMLVRFRKGLEAEALEARFQPRGGLAVPCALRINAVKDPDGSLVGLRWLVQDIREIVEARQVLARSNGSLARRVAERTAQLQKLEDEVLNSIEREQERIGRDLHDGLCQLLVGAKFRSAYLNTVARGEPAAEQEARALEESLNEAIEQTRNFARELNPVKFRAADFTTVLQKLAASVDGVQGPRCRCEVGEGVQITRQDTAYQLYRIAQEALQNALKHARAKNIAIHLTRRANQIVLTVEDDGAGISAGAQRAGMGLDNMQTRARQIGGEFAITRRSRGGTVVRCELPEDAA